MFNKQILISVTRAEFLQLLAEKGLNVPAHTPIRGGQEDWACDIDFPITIKWEEKGVFGSRVPRHPNVTIYQEDEIARANKKQEEKVKREAKKAKQ